MVGRLNVGIITPPRGEAATIPLSNLVNIFNALANELYIVTGGNVRILQERTCKKIHIYKIDYKICSNVMMKAINHLSMQLRFSIKIFRLVRNVDVWVFFLDGESLLLPLLTAKLKRGKVLLAMTASIPKTVQARKDYLTRILVCFRVISCILSSGIIIYSDNLIKEWQLEKYRDKILIAHEHFLNFSEFRIKKRVSERDRVVGYVARLSEEKGILNFLQAIPIVLKRKDFSNFVIGGDGPLTSEIKEYVNNSNLNNKVKLVGWIPREELPSYLNELKLLVLPSFSEGLPNILLEAMACGTPILATPVGTIPDIIKDGETGFLLETNDPKHIADKIVELLNEPELLEKVSANAYKWAKQNFNREKTLNSWRRIFQDWEC